jgi:hypothetical protein
VPEGNMKLLYRPDLFGWSRFDESRNVDFCGVAWARSGGNVLIDPLPMSEHDLAHLEALGGAALIVITNSDHTRDAQTLAQRLGATLYGPRAERETFPSRVSAGSVMAMSRCPVSPCLKWRGARPLASSRSFWKRQHSSPATSCAGTWGQTESVARGQAHRPRTSRCVGRPYRARASRDRNRPGR